MVVYISYNMGTQDLPNMPSGLGIYIWQIPLSHVIANYCIAQKFDGETFMN